MSRNESYAIVKSKLETKEYYVARNPDKKLKSKVWETFYIVLDQNKEVVDGFARCILCNLLVSLPLDGSTGNMNTHLKKCINQGDQNQTTICVFLLI